MAERDRSERVEPRIFSYPRGLIPPCGYTIDPDLEHTCGRDPVYEFKLKGFDARGSACAEHALVIREWPDLDWIHSL
jgi:hypothetical protein